MPARPRVVAASAVLLLVAACSGGHSGTSAATTSTSSSPSTSSTVAGGSSSTTPTTISGTCTQADPNVLAPLLPQKLVPAGFVMQPDSDNETGPTDFAKAVSDDGEKDASTVLKQDGFRRGYQRQWAHADGRKLLAVVDEFCSVDGAKAYADRAAKLGVDSTTSPFTVSGVPGAVGIIVTDDKTSAIALVQATPGRYVIVASASGLTTVLTRAQAEQLATDLARGLVAELTANV